MNRAPDTARYRELALIFLRTRPHPWGWTKQFAFERGVDYKRLGQMISRVKKERQS